uniref:Uncharacterized protein n=1 Tax=Octopus bimaculoides TaxID=37653 RepID=A0A0L8HUE3_OCTBM
MHFPTTRYIPIYICSNTVLYETFPTSDNVDITEETSSISILFLRQKEIM